jgi:hypothetical protein
MQPQKRKVLVMVAVSLGIITSAFLIPIVVIPTVLEVSKASNCAVAAGCAENTFSRCGAYQSSGDTNSFGNAMERGMKGLICMIGLDSPEAKTILLPWNYHMAATLNKT